MFKKFIKFLLNTFLYEIKKIVIKNPISFSLNKKDNNFFNRSFVENIDVLEDDITFQKVFAESVKMKIKDFGLTEDVYNNFPGKLDIDSKSTSEILYLTKVLGNYNITKINNTFIFENEGHAVALEKI